MIFVPPPDPHQPLFSDDFQPVLAMKFLVESEFQGQGPGKPPETPEPPVPSGSPEWVLVLTDPIYPFFGTNLPPDLFPKMFQEMSRKQSGFVPETTREMSGTCLEIPRKCQTCFPGNYQKGIYRDHQYQNPLGGFWWYRWFWWFSRFLALKFGFYKEISPPELAGNRRKTKIREKFPGKLNGGSGGPPGLSLIHI